MFHTEENMIQCIVNTNKNVRLSEWEKSWKRTLWKLLLTIVEVIIKVKQKIVFRPKVSWQHFFETIVADIWSTVSVWRWHSSFLVHRYLTIVLLLFFLKKKSKITFTGKKSCEALQTLQPSSEGHTIYKNYKRRLLFCHL